jgi:hypothetical protein
MEMSPAEMSEILSPNGRVSASLAAVGITKEMVQKYSNTQTGGIFSRLASGDVGGSTEGGRNVARFQSGGFSSLLKGKSRAEQAAVFTSLERMAVGAGIAATPGAANIELRAMAQRDSTSGYLGVPGIKGRHGRAGGSYGAARLKDTVEGTAQAHKGVTLTDEEQKRAEESGLFRRVVPGMTATEGTADTGRKNAVRAAGKGTPQEAISGVEQALTAFVASLQAMSSGKGTKGNLENGGAPEGY